MTHVRVVPELHLIYNPTTGVIAEERDDVVEYSMDDVKTQLNELDLIVTDMMNQLSPSAKLLNSFPGREKTSYRAGIITNAFYGAVIGFIVSFLMLLILGLGEEIRSLISMMGGT